MADYLQEAEKIKIKLYRLHFLLTEPESDEIMKDGVKQFKICFQEIIGFLSDFLFEEFSINAESHLAVLTASFKKKLFTESMITSLKEMEIDFQSLNYQKIDIEIYKRIKAVHAQHLQVIYDMLTHMGEDASDETDK